ncbi:uncharacterized protein LOC130242039 [Danio aesculapii]|uniref:uncharacterized protein LOC130242039 n=1 Tax=Danio aesculapii TaxID=1142201 RepID=UPI0024C0A65E|nr:uncharacterized protein LOC130242039 [Danio aesculapii]
MNSIDLPNVEEEGRSAVQHHKYHLHHQHLYLTSEDDSHIYPEPEPASMQFTMMFLRGFLLLFLLLRWTESEEEVNPMTLVQMINFVNMVFKNNISERPYAVGINVPRNQCLGQIQFQPENLEGLWKNLLRNETYAQQVQNKLYNDCNGYYKATDIVAVHSEAVSCKDTEDCRSSSVFSLLNDPAHAPFTELLERAKDSCTVLFTTYCPNLNKTGQYNIKDALDNWINHTGVKAFVFEKGIGNNFCDGSETFSKSVPDVPLYHCMNETCCACKNGNCVPPSPAQMNSQCKRM